ncbi:uncharacterized protein TNCV_2091441 [Trichonephila clavipes]|nr:uncharacterized protein TNCV_2091441 [Trichonephila clavipes]
MTLHSPTENSLAVLNHKILEANSQVQNVKLGGHQTCLSINRLWHELCDMLRRLGGMAHAQIVKEREGEEQCVLDYFCTNQDGRQMYGENKASYGSVCFYLYLRKLRYRLDTGQTKSSSPLSNSAMSLLKKYGAFFNPKLILRGRYVPKLVQKAAYRCAVLLKGICQYPLDVKNGNKFSRRYFFYAFFDIRKRKIFRSNDPV